MKRSLIHKSGAVLLALALWQGISMLVNMDILLASPLKVIKRLATIWTEKGFVSTVLFSLMRITCGFLIALALGIILAVLAGRFSIVETLLWPYVVTIKSVPVASFIILCLIWFSFNQLTVFIAFLIAFPVIYSNVLQGIKSADPNMLEMARLYDVSWGRRLLYIYVPNIKPYLISACSVAVGMAWKAGVAAEVIGVVNGSIGEKLYNAKIYFQNADLLAWTVIIILLSVVIEKLFVFILKKIYEGVEKL
ncbi:MAG: ABC transporter permease subunit [Oscillospiraceae bacterium]|nr:ABC transporter permease subunit [Oscillospiraceae bacterium]